MTRCVPVDHSTADHELTACFVELSKRDAQDRRAWLKKRPKSEGCVIRTHPREIKADNCTVSVWLVVRRKTVTESPTMTVLPFGGTNCFEIREMTGFSPNGRGGRQTGHTISKIELSAFKRRGVKIVLMEATS